MEQPVSWTTNGPGVRLYRCRKVGHPGPCNLCPGLVVRHSDSKKPKPNHSVKEMQRGTHPRILQKLSPIPWRKSCDLLCFWWDNFLWREDPINERSVLLRKAFTTFKKISCHRIKNVIASLNCRGIQSKCFNFGPPLCPMSQTADFQNSRLTEKNKTHYISLFKWHNVFPS